MGRVWADGAGRVWGDGAGRNEATKRRVDEKKEAWMAGQLSSCIEHDELLLMLLCNMSQEEVTPRHSRWVETTVSLDGDTLLQVQKWDDKETTFVREIKDGKLVMNLTFGEVHAVRTYEKA
ncbi:hypothetical protein NHX12_026279 [Muraenolepis orangiensis]|uniref:Uncharacterized protein n=1 Tax=Muraenolepis orangiensis TaxID=630683 RepID=A0A9Q0IQL8_9TELE|nr:hypothetical protein NHX12_026279 [Muraenolepis orangiensis]